MTDMKYTYMYMKGFTFSICITNYDDTIFSECLAIIFREKYICNVFSSLSFSCHENTNFISNGKHLVSHIMIVLWTLGL